MSDVEKGKNREDFEGDYLPPIEGDEDPLSNLQIDQAFIESLLHPEPQYSPVSFRLLLSAMEKWEEIRNAVNYDEQGDFNDEHSEVGYIGAKSAQSQNPEALQSFPQYLRNTHNIDLKEDNSLIVSAQYGKGEQPRIIISDYQGKIFAYFFEVQIGKSANKTKYHAFVQITDKKGTVIYRRYVPISREEITLADEGSIVVTQPILDLLVPPVVLNSEGVDITDPEKTSNPWYNLEILGVYTDLESTNFDVP